MTKHTANKEYSLGNMTKRIKKLDLDSIPLVLEKVTSVINDQVEILSKKQELTNDDSKNLIAYANTLRELYKDHRAQIAEIKKDLKDMSKEQILSLVKSEAVK